MNEERPATPEKAHDDIPQTPEAVEAAKQSLSAWVMETIKSGRTAREILTCAYTENIGFLSIFSNFEWTTKSSQSTDSTRDNTKSTTTALKVTLLVGLLLALGINFYSSSRNRQRARSAVASHESDAEIKSYFELGLAPGPPDILRKGLATLEEKAAKGTSGLSEIEKKRLLFLRDLKAKGRL